MVSGRSVESPSRAARAALLFFLRVFVIYTVLALPWPGVFDLYARAYRTVANSTFGGFGGDGVVRFEETSDDVRFDTMVSFRRKGSSVVGSTPHSIRMTGYLPTVQVVALILATPIAWSRRRRALVVGLLLIHAFVALRLLIALVHWFSGDSPWCLYHPGSVGKSVIEHAFELAVVSPTLTFVVPLFVWIAATFRRADLAALTESRSRSSKAQNPENHKNHNRPNDD